LSCATASTSGPSENAKARTSQFAALNKPALNPLPTEPFDLSQWSRARVNIDYHIVFDPNFYSVPYNLVQEPGGSPLDDHDLRAVS
jgi:hypothetical protein